MACSCLEILAAEANRKSTNVSPAALPAVLFSQGDNEGVAVLLANLAVFSRCSASAIGTSGLDSFVIAAIFASMSVMPELGRWVRADRSIKFGPACPRLAKQPPVGPAGLTKSSTTAFGSWPHRNRDSVRLVTRNGYALPTDSH